MRFDLPNSVIIVPDRDVSPAVIVYGGLYGWEGAWFLDKIPVQLQENITFILPTSYRNSCATCLEELSTKVSPRRITSLSLCGYSRGGIEVYRNWGLRDWEILGLIDPSAPTMGGFQEKVLDGVSNRIRCVYWVPNWGENGYGGQIPRFDAHLHALRVNMVDNEEIPHVEMPSFFFRKFGADFMSLVKAGPPSGGDTSQEPTQQASQSARISASVGRNCANRTSDVLAVQKLLNAAGAGIKEDGKSGRGTISAIEEYQHNWTEHPDGRVDIGGKTWKNLVAGKLTIKRASYVVLPQVSGYGYYPYSSRDRQFGTSATVASIIRVCQNFAKKHPTLQIGVGDMSFANAAEMSPHKTHRSGRNTDLRPLRKDGKMLPVKTSDDEYSHDLTAALVQSLREESNLKSILFNDSGISGVTHWEGHDNHLHVSMKE